MPLKKAGRPSSMRTSDYARLAAFRQGLREFLRFSEDAAGRVGLATQHYQAMLEAADLVVAGKHKEAVQDESQATYEGWFRANEAKVHWHNHVDFIHNLIRGADPAPGAWTTLAGKKVQLFGSRKHPVRTFGAVRGKVGEVVEVTEKSFQVTAQGGRIEVLRAKLGDGKKVAAAELLSSGQIKAGTLLGT